MSRTQRNPFWNWLIQTIFWIRITIFWLIWKSVITILIWFILTRFRKRFLYVSQTRQVWVSYCNGSKLTHFPGYFDQEAISYFSSIRGLRWLLQMCVFSDWIILRKKKKPNDPISPRNENKNSCQFLYSKS